jgi:hypothetical protein
MLKKILIVVGFIALLIALFLVWFMRYTKSHSPQEVIEYKTDGFEIDITYCKPSKKNRLIFGDKADKAVVPFGQYWRMGANEATVFSTAKDIFVNGKQLKSGKYALYAIPNKDNWEIHFNSEFERWGATAPNAENDVLVINVAPSTSASLVEQLSMQYNKREDNQLELLIHWDLTQVSLILSTH